MTFQKISFLFSIIFVFLFCASCAFHTDKDSDTDSSIALLSPQEQAQLSYSYVYSEVFSQNCIGCHGTSGGFSVESYAGVKSQIQNVQRDALGTIKTMPKSGPKLTPRQLSILYTWIYIGAPEFGTIAAPPVETFKPNYTSFKKFIYPRCTECHTDFGDASDVPLDSYGGMFTSLPAHDSPAGPLVIPKDPDNSRLIIAVSRSNTDKLRMPPLSHTGLSAQDIATLREWVNSGAPEN